MVWIAASEVRKLGVAWWLPTTKPRASNPQTNPNHLTEVSRRYASGPCHRVRHAPRPRLLLHIHLRASLLGCPKPGDCPPFKPTKNDSKATADNEGRPKSRETLPVRLHARLSQKSPLLQAPEKTTIDTMGCSQNEDETASACRAHVLKFGLFLGAETAGVSGSELAADLGVVHQIRRAVLRSARISPGLGGFPKGCRRARGSKTVLAYVSRRFAPFN